MDPHDNQYQLVWMGVTHLLYVKALVSSNSIWIIALQLSLVKTKVSELLFGDPYRIRTDVNGVRGRCLNHLTNGPLVQLQRLEPGTH